MNTFFSIIFLFATTSFAAHNLITEDDILEDINCVPGEFFDDACASLLELGDTAASSFMHQVFTSDAARQLIGHFAFADDNKKFAVYDHHGVYTRLPAQGVSFAALTRLIDDAAKERREWAHGKMSGAIYDGSTKQMDLLASAFADALPLDPHLSHHFTKKSKRFDLLVRAFREFNTANPLHGTSFPFAVKAMRELASMLAHVFGAEHAIPASGDGLRLGMKAQKNLARVSHEGQVHALALGEDHAFKDVADSLNIKLISSTSTTGKAIADEVDAGTIDFIVLHLDKFDADSKNILTSLSRNSAFPQLARYPIHIHLSAAMFAELMNDQTHYLRNVFGSMPALASISMETTGVLFGDVNACIFRDRAQRYLAFESHIDWVGGIYPGVTSQGSIAGVDFILSYLFALYLGEEGLMSNARRYLKNQTPLIQHVDRDDDLTKKLIQTFHSPASRSMKTLEHLRSKLAMMDPDSRRDFAEQLLFDVSKSIYNANDNFSGLITSGGTESIRLAMQTYVNRFRKLHPGKRPRFLMTKTAHVAFDRHLVDNDAEIVRVDVTRQHKMDIDHLRNLIETYGAENIAGIVASTPAYPYGISDDIQAIAAIAKHASIPFHVDACLGGFMLQFATNASATIDFADKEWDGVTSVSSDMHKYGAFAKGSSLMLIRNESVDGTMSIGRFLPSTSILARRGLPSLYSGLSALLSTRDEGYRARQERIIATAEQLIGKLQKLTDITTVKASKDNPHWVIALRMDRRYHAPATIYTVKKLLDDKGYRLNSIGDNTIHLALTYAHAREKNFVKDFMTALTETLNVIRTSPAVSTASTGVYGMASSLPTMSFGVLSQREYLNAALKAYAENLVSIR